MEYELKPLRQNRTPNNRLLKYLARWQCNNSPLDLGIKRFIFELFWLNDQLGYPFLIRDFNPEYDIAPWASDALSEWFYYVPGMTKEDRCHVIATHREGSKTFWFSFVLPVYLILIGQFGIYYKNYLLPEYDYIVLRAKNNREAQKRILNVVSFLNRPIIKLLFGNLKPSFKEVKEKEGKDTGQLMIFSNGYIFEGSGIEQPSRGLNLLQVRPKLFVFDDVQNKENTKTSERRQQIDAEVMEESFGAVADEGSMIYIGNKVHAADTLGRLLDRQNKIWKKHFYTLTVNKDKDGNYISPGVGDLDIESPLWDRRWTIQRVQKLKEFYESQPELGGLKGFLKEYYNLIKSDTDYKLQIYYAEYVREHGINWLVFTVNGQKVYKNVYIVVANDPAISEKKTASDAVVSVVAVTSDRRRYILEMNFGKWDLHDRYFDESQKLLLARTPEDMTLIKRKGSVEECARMCIKYNADALNIEVAGQQWAFYNETKNLLDKLGWKGVMRPEPAPSEGKDEKLKQVPLIYFEAGLYYLKDNHIELRNDIIAFPDCRKDRLDSLYLAEQVISFPIEIPYNPLGHYGKSDSPIRKTSIYKAGQYLNEHESWVSL